MMGKVLFLVMMSWCLVESRICDSCVKYTFEKDFDEYFTTLGFCAGLLPWKIAKFEDKSVTSFHESSTQIMYAEGYSCVSSFKFAMNPNGIVEVNIYMKDPAAHDVITVMVFDNVGANAGQVQVSGSTYPGGWQTVKIKVLGLGPFKGQLAFLGMASAASTVLVDSFRYIPPGMSESDCKLYDLKETVSTTESIIGTTSEISIESTTESITDGTTHSTSNTPTESIPEDPPECTPERPPECTPEIPPECTPEIPPECGSLKAIEIDMETSITISIA